MTGRNVKGSVAPVHSPAARARLLLWMFFYAL